MTTKSSCKQELETKLNKRNQALQDVISLTLNEQAIEVRNQRAVSTEYVIDGLAIRGDITVLFASPNTGKTLLAISLLTQTKALNSTGLEIFHINLDDSYDGLTMKAKLGLTGGFRVFDTSNFGTPLTSLNNIFIALINGDAARDTVFVLDTVKKFTDPMDKKASSDFMRSCRAYTQAGGTLILLAHNNKQTPNNPTPTPGGTSDLQDDADAVYVMSTIKQESCDTGTQYYVQFENRKARGPNATQAVFSFIKTPDADYENMFWSVTQESVNESLQNSASSASLDQKLTKAITETLTDQPLTQSQIIEALSKSFGKNKVRQHLQALTNKDGEHQLLYQSRGYKNSVIYELIPQEASA